MRVRVSVLAVLLVVAGQAGLAAGAGDAGEPGGSGTGGRGSSGTCSVVGLVRDTTSARPVRSAHVLVLGGRRATISDSLGWFRLDSLPAGPHTLRCVAFGYESSARTSVARPGTPDTVTFRLRRINFDSTIIDTIARPRR